MRITLISDTHSYLGQDVQDALAGCDEIWHAGDVGDSIIIDQLNAIATTRGVFGNIDDTEVRALWPENQLFIVDGVKVFMTHIGGYPGRYNARVKQILEIERPDLYICGHSHILKVMPDQTRNLIHMNPGACGHHGFHVIRTILRFNILDKKVRDVEVVEFGRRGIIAN